MGSISFSSKFEKRLAYILVFSFIYTSNGIELEYYNKMRIASGCVLILLCIMEIWRESTIKIMGAYVIAAGLFVFINILNYSGTYLKLISRMAIWAAVLIFCLHLRRRGVDVEELVECTTLGIAIMALIFWLAVNVLHLELPHSIKYRYMYSYYGLYNYVPTSVVYLGPISFRRMNGMFTEPGTYAVFLCLAIYYYIVKERRRTWEIAVLYINLFLSFSATGLIIGLMLIGYKVMKNKKIKGKGVFLFPLIPIFLWVVYYLVQSKKEIGAEQGLMYGARLFDLVNGFKLFLKYPLLGAGYYNFNDFIYLESNFLNRLNSNGMMNLLYTMGIIGFLVFFFPFAENVFVYKRKRKIDAIVYFIVIALLNLSQPITFYPVMTLLIAERYAELFWRKGGKTISRERLECGVEI